MKFLAIILTLSSMAYAERRVVLDETYKTTFSDYGALGLIDFFYLSGTGRNKFADSTIGLGIGGRRV
jgi:hypothetical protein